MKKIVVVEILFRRMEKKAIALRSKDAVTHVYLQVAQCGGRRFHLRAAGSVEWSAQSSATARFSDSESSTLPT
jgi:hypothetical protein